MALLRVPVVLAAVLAAVLDKMVSKSFLKWINSTQKNSPLFYLIKDDPEVEKAREEEDLLPKTEDEKESEEIDSFRKYQQYANAVN